MRHWLSNIDWTAIVGAALLTILLAVIFQPSSFQPKYVEAPQGTENTQEESPEIARANLISERIARYTFWLSIFTGVLACSTIGLWGATYRSSKIAEETLIADKRAFVLAADLSSRWTLDEETGQYLWRFQPVWANSGDTPTKGMTLHSNGALR